MNIIVNGLKETIEPGLSITELVEILEEQESGLIVEVNGRFVHPRDYQNLAFEEGDKVELIHPAFGG